MGYKFYILIVLLLFLSLGSVCASGDDYGIEPVNDSFANNDTEFIDEFPSSIDSGFDNDDFNSSFDDLVFDNSSLDFNSSNRDFVFNNSSLDFNFSFDEGGGNSPLSLIQTSISASNLVMDFQDGSTLNAYLKDKNNNPLSGKTLKFNINGINYNCITNSNGCAELIISENPGVYTTTISFQGSGYASSSKTVTVTVHEMPTNIAANNISMYYRDGSAISATLTDRNGNPLVNKTIVLNLDGHNYTRVTNGNGRIGFGIYARPGNYTFNLTFEDIGYIPSSRLVNVVVYEMPTNIDSNDVNMYYRDGSAISATLTGINGMRLANKTITLNLNGHNYTRVTNDNGRIGFGIYARPGNYTFNLTFEDIGYIPSSRLVNVVVYEMPTNIDSNDVNMYYRDGSAISATLTGINGMRLANKTITLNLNGHNYTRVTNDNGRIGFGLFARPGNYTFNLTFEDIGYTPSSKLVNVIVNEIPANLSSNDINMYYRDGSAISATLTGINGTPLTNKTITLDLNGHIYTRITNNNGRIGFGIYARPGNYTFNLTFQEIGYTPSSKLVNVIVYEMPTSIIANDVVMYYRDGSAISATLKDRNGNPLVNKTITFNLAGHNSTRVTNDNGRVGFGIYARPNNYTILITFEDIGYTPSTKTVHVRVNEMPTTITANNLIMEYGDDSRLYVYLKDKDNNPLINKSLTFNINCENYTRITNNAGCANVKINLWPGRYNATISFTQIGYLTSIKTTQITVTINGTLPPTINAFSGFYDNDYLLVNFTAYSQDYIVYYSFDDGNHWAYDNNYACFNLTSGNWTIKYFSSYQNQNSTILTVNYLIDGSAPITWASHGSGIYTESINVNLTSVDFFDENPIIYYTTNGANPTLNSNIYQNPILISNNTNLRFFSRDSFNHISEVISIYYFIGENVCNLNNGKTYSKISDALNDYTTQNGDVIEISNGIFEENLTINKSITLIGNNNAQIKGNLIVTENNVSIYNCNFHSNLKITVNDFNLINSNITSNAGSNLNITGNNSKIIGSTLKNTNGNAFYIVNASNIIFSDCIINSTYGNYLISTSNCTFFNNTFLKNNHTALGENKFYIINSFNNTFYGNNMSCGLVLNNSGDNVFYSNWISDNLNFYLIYIDSAYLTNTFYLNYIFNGVWRNYKLQGVYISPYSHVDLTNNWWGSRDARINIMYTRMWDVVLDGFITIKTYIGSYHIENGIIKSVEVIADLTCNIRGSDLSSVGFVPDGIPVNFYSDFESFNSTIINGKSKKIMNMDLNENYTTFFTGFALDSNSVSVNKIAKVDLHVISTALCNGSYLDFTYNFELNESVSWVSVIYRSLDNFTSEVNLVVNGHVVKQFEVMSSNYVYCKNNGVGDNVLNAVHMYNDCLYNEYSKIRSDIDVYNALDFNIFDLNQLHSQFSQGDYMPWLSVTVLDYFNVTKEDVLLVLIGNYFNLSYDDLSFVKNYHDLFRDDLMVYLNYPGDTAKQYNVDEFELDFPGNEVYAYSKISYVNGAYTHLDETVSSYIPTYFHYTPNNITYADGYNRGHVVNSDYDGFLTYTFICDKLTDEDLIYWLNEKNKTYTNGSLVYEGFMKACYGSFLNGFLTYYCVDKVADIAADKFNVSWNRSTPICISVYDNSNITALSGRSDFRFGMDVYGDETNVRAFRFVVTSMFSQIEYWVMQALFPKNSPYGSVTMGLANLLLDGHGLEFFLEDNLLVIRENGTNKRVLVFELDTGIFSDVMNNGSYGSYCYYDQQTEWAFALGLFLMYFDEYFDEYFNVYLGKFDNHAKGNASFIDAVEEGVNSCFNQNIGFLDGVDNTYLGLVGSTAITVGMGLLLVSNPVGWAVGIGAGLLIGAGIITTYFADDLNRGWNYNRATHFIFDVGTSMIPSGGVSSLLKGTAARVGSIVLSDGRLVRHVTKQSVNSGFDKYLMNLAKANGGALDYGSHTIDRYGTLESVYNTMYWSTVGEFIDYHMKILFFKHVIFPYYIDNNP